MLTWDNTSEAIKCVETYLDRDMTSSGTITVDQKTDTSESEEILSLKTELVEIKAAQATVTHNKRHRDGVSNNGTVT